MKTNNLTIGRVYYMSICGNPTDFKQVTLLEITGKNKVLVEDRKGHKFECNSRKLHKHAEQAVRGRKAQERAKHQVKLMEIAERKKSVDNKIQKRLNALKPLTYAFMDENGKIIVADYFKAAVFNTTDELQDWIDVETIRNKEMLKKIREYKFIQITTKSGEKRYHRIISVSAKKFEIVVHKNEISTIDDESKGVEKENIKEFTIKMV